MKRISTPYTFSFKIFPFLYFGFIGIFVALVMMGDGWRRQPEFLAIPGMMAIGGYWFMKLALGDLVDEVFDCGDFLLIRKGGEKERVSLSDIINVNFAVNQRPARITLTLARPGKFGSLVSFALPPRIYLHPVPRSEIAEDLIVRAHNARSKPRKKGTTE
jgi:hypothetical protein